uniref:Uncharacterized protein n=1 Tax=Lepeophtheirus salmonis TaxID=72036 RepID=A0A0K2TXN2_LEPSM
MYRNDCKTRQTYFYKTRNQYYYMTSLLKREIDAIH